MHVEHPEEFGVAAHCQLICGSHTLIDRLPGELLHLDVVELPEVAEPLDQLGGDAAIELEKLRGSEKILLKEGVLYICPSVPLNSTKGTSGNLMPAVLEGRERKT